MGNILYSWLIFWEFGRKIFVPPFIALDPLLFTLLAVVNEELLNRVFLIGLVVFVFRKSKYAWFIAIITSSIYWGALHMGLGYTDWVKFVQVLPFGLFLGYCLRKYGFETSLLVHALSNLVVLIT